MMRALLVLLLLTVPAFARAPEVSDPDLGPWFHSLMQPTGATCCDQSDGHILGDDEWREGKDAPQVKIDGAWVDVDAARVLKTENPTGRAVAFWLPGQSFVYCFIRPAQG